MWDLEHFFCDGVAFILNWFLGILVNLCGSLMEEENKDVSNGDMVEK